MQGNPNGVQNAFTGPVPHYYGDVVRALFVVSALVMLAALPFFSDQLPFSPSSTILAVVVLGLAAGFTSPKKPWVAILNAGISFAAVVIFGYFGVQAFKEFSPASVLFWMNEGLALLFLLSLYFSTKTVRGMMCI